MADDLRRFFHHDVDALTEELEDVAGNIPPDLRTATKAMLGSGPGDAEEIASRERAIDERAAGLEETSKRLLALQQPVAIDLRTLLAVLRLATQIDRSAQLVSHIAEIAQRIDGAHVPGAVQEQLGTLADASASVYEMALAAFVERDADKARQVDAADDVVDTGMLRLYDLMQETMGTGDVDVKLIVDLGLAGRHMERISDHGVILAEQTIYLIEGPHPA